MVELTQWVQVGRRKGFAGGVGFERIVEICGKNQRAHSFKNHPQTVRHAVQNPCPTRGSRKAKGVAKVGAGEKIGDSTLLDAA